MTEWALVISSPIPVRCKWHNLLLLCTTHLTTAPLWVDMFQFLSKACIMDDIFQQLIFLSPEMEETREFNTFIESRNGLRSTSPLKQTAEIKHRMHKYVWEGRLSRAFTDLATELLDRERKGDLKFWLAHVTGVNQTGMKPSLSDGSYTFDVSRCCAGALINPFTFCSHVVWKENKRRRIKSSFDFDRQMLIVEFLRRSLFPAWKMEISFAELRRACIVQPETGDGGLSFSLYVYLSCAPSFWREKHGEREHDQSDTVLERIIQIPGAEKADIGKCSVLKLDLNIEHKRELFTLLDKLDACEFEVWWSTLSTVPAKNELRGRLVLPWPVEWLLSEGYRISDQLSSVDLECLSEHQDILYTAFKGVLSREIIVNVMEELRVSLEDKTAWPIPELPKNYTLIKKVVVTPTRVIFMSPEPVEMNRALRDYNPNNFVMVLFRDENQQPLHFLSSPGSNKLVKRIKTILLHGLEAERRTYTFLSFSKIQLRKHSCWMYARDPETGLTVDDIRHSMGDLAGTRCVAKYTSRLGQFFTSSVPTVDLSKQNYKVIETPDVERNGYCFTDGFGKMSRSLAEEISKQCGLSRTCSAYQVLLGGCQGILTVDPKLPERELQIRPSMKHFDSAQNVLEVIGYSQPQRAYLNQHIITEMYNQGISDEVLLRLQVEYLRHLLEMFASNENALLELDDVQPMFDLREICERGINIVSDPFFRSILLVRYKEKLNDLIEHAIIPVPLDKGRVLMGVVDETGQLQPGQVFLQYSNNICDRESERTVLSGPVLVTPYECVQPGDFHVFQAVNCPDLCHLVDCLVFPTQGDKPHPSRHDLDNNLYWTTWHPDLVIQPNEEQMKMSHATANTSQPTPTVGNVIENFIHSVRFVPLEPKSRKYPDFKSQMKLEQILFKLLQDSSLMGRTTDVHLDIIRELSQNDTKHIYRSTEFGKIDIPDSYRKTAETYYKDYATRVQHILDKFQVRDESHLFAGSVRGMKNNDKQECGLLMQAEINQLKRDYTDIFENKDCSVSLPIKAMTWFNIAYDKGRLRSFAWIASIVIASVLDENTGHLSQWYVMVEDYCKRKNMFDSSHLDDEIKSFLQIQASATDVFLKAINSALPGLHCSLVPTELDKWQIPSRDIFIQIRHPNAKDFAEMCSVMPSLLQPQKVEAFDHPNCCITRTEILKKLTVRGQEFTVHVYKDGAVAKVLHDITSNITSELFSKCLQILTQFWMISLGKVVPQFVSVIHISEIFLFFYLKKNQSRDVSEVLKRFFLHFTDFNALVEFQRSSDLFTLKPKSLRLFQLSLLTGLQLLRFYGTHAILNHNINCAHKKQLLDVISISAKTSAVIKDRKEFAVNYIAERSGCNVSVRCVGDEKDKLFVVEGFGNKLQLARLAGVIYHIENIARMYSIRFGRPSGYRYEPIFENSTTEEDSVITVPYNGQTTFPHFFKKIRIFLNPASNDGNAVPNLDDVIDKYCAIIERIREDYDEHFYGHLRVTCRFTNFHFSTKRPIEFNTVRDFLNALNENDSLVRTCNFPAEVNRDKMDTILKRKGLKQNGTPKCIVVAVILTQDTVKEFVLNEKLEMEHIQYRKFGVGSVNYLRSVKRVPGQEYGEKMADLYIRLDARQDVPDSEKPRKPIVSVDMPNNDHDMPLLKVEQEFEETVTYIRQKKVTIYNYPASLIKQKPDHFAAHVKVEIIESREYDMKNERIDESTSAVIILPALAPSCQEEDHRDLIRNMMQLAIDVGESMN